MLHKLLVLTIVSFSMFIAACEPDTPGERIAESVKDVGNEIEDACEDVKQEAGADDTNC